MLQEVAEIWLPLGSGNKADEAVKGGVFHEGSSWLSLCKGRSLQKVFLRWREALQSFRFVLGVGQS